MARLSYHITSLAVVILVCLLAPRSSADSAGDYDLPGPGLAYGGIPYGSVSGNLAAYFRPRGPTYNYKPNVRRAYSRNNINYDFFSRDFD